MQTTTLKKKLSLVAISSALAVGTGGCKFNTLTKNNSIFAQTENGAAVLATVPVANETTGGTSMCVYTLTTSKSWDSKAANDEAKKLVLAGKAPAGSRLITRKKIPHDLYLSQLKSLDATGTAFSGLYSDALIIGVLSGSSLINSNLQLVRKKVTDVALVWKDRTPKRELGFDTGTVSQLSVKYAGAEAAEGTRAAEAVLQGLARQMELDSSLGSMAEILDSEWQETMRLPGGKKMSKQGIQAIRSAAADPVNGPQWNLFMKEVAESSNISSKADVEGLLNKWARQSSKGVAGRQQAIDALKSSNKYDEVLSALAFTVSDKNNGKLRQAFQELVPKVASVRAQQFEVYGNFLKTQRIADSLESILNSGNVEELGSFMKKNTSVLNSMKDDSARAFSVVANGIDDLFPKKFRGGIKGATKLVDDIIAEAPELVTKSQAFVEGGAKEISQNLKNINRTGNSAAKIASIAEEIRPNNSVFNKAQLKKNALNAGDNILSKGWNMIAECFSGSGGAKKVAGRMAACATGAAVAGVVGKNALASTTSEVHQAQKLIDLTTADFLSEVSLEDFTLAVDRISQMGTSSEELCPVGANGGVDERAITPAEEGEPDTAGENASDTGNSSDSSNTSSDDFTIPDNDDTAGNGDTEDNDGF